MGGDSGTRDWADVRAANEPFYRALESLNLAEMGQGWAHRDHVAWADPRWSRLHGAGQLRRSWAASFRNTTKMRCTITVGRVEVRDDLGRVHCTENLGSEARGRLSTAAILATNIFEHQATRWRLAHHHASHIPAPRGAGADAA